MTAFDRFDPFERRITDAIDEIAAARRPEYLDDLLRQTARTAQRPRWSFLERWLRMDTSLPRAGFAGRLPVRPLVLLAILALLASAVFYVAASRPHLPPPFGPAGNGLVAYTRANDLYVRDPITGASRLLIGGDGIQGAPNYSPDGQWISYATSGTGPDLFMVARADGSDPRLLATIPATGFATAMWRPDSQALAFVYDVGGVPTFSIVNVDGSKAPAVDLHGMAPSQVGWQPPSGSHLVIRVVGADGRADLVTMLANGSDWKAFGLNRSSTIGSEYPVSGPVWSPDGTTIAYNDVETVTGADGKPYSHFRIRLISADGTRDRAAAGPSDVKVQEAWPVFSPDGRWIVVQRWVFLSDSTVEPNGWLAVMPADGSAPARDIGPMIPGGEYAGPSKIWSPDGTHILARADQMQKVFSIDPTTGAYETLPWTTELPDWQRVSTP